MGLWVGISPKSSVFRGGLERLGTPQLDGEKHRQLLALLGDALRLAGACSPTARAFVDLPVIKFQDGPRPQDGNVSNGSSDRDDRTFLRGLDRAFLGHCLCCVPISHGKRRLDARYREQGESWFATTFTFR